MHTEISTPAEVSVCDVLRVRPWELEREFKPPRRTAYRAKLGRVPIQLSPVEYRILSFLAATPYRAYTPARIVSAVNNDRCSVTEETLSGHITSLRRKLGFFRDYVQSVPYIGYRFKA